MNKRNVSLAALAAIFIGLFGLSAGSARPAAVITATPGVMESVTEGLPTSTPATDTPASDDNSAVSSPIPVPPQEKAQKNTANIPAPMGDPSTPVRVSIPNAGIDKNVIKVGLNDKGEMDVPDGKSDNIGWYQYGTVPGNIGSAVLDAHVYAALSRLKYAKAGDDIYLTMGDSRVLHFRVTDATEYRLEDVSADELFSRADAKRLNLITCSGTYIPARGTYDHRLIVHAILVE